MPPLLPILHACGDVAYGGLGVGFDDGALVLSRKEATAEESNAPVGWYRSTTLKHNVTRQILVFGSEAIQQPRPKARPRKRLLARAHLQAGAVVVHIVGVHRARAEFFALHGAYTRAIQHLEYAQRLVRRTNPQLVAKLTQRIQDLRTAIRMQS